MKRPSPVKLLFVCSRNQWRSPTAEAIFHGVRGCEARSAGTEPAARVRVTEKTIGWADWIFCMEKRHVERLRARFDPALFEGKRLVRLDISDDYAFMDPELVALLETAVGEHLELSSSPGSGKSARPG